MARSDGQWVVVDRDLASILAFDRFDIGFIGRADGQMPPAVINGKPDGLSLDSKNVSDHGGQQFRVAAGLAAEDIAKRFLLLLIGALVEVQHNFPVAFCHRPRGVERKRYIQIIKRHLAVSSFLDVPADQGRAVAFCRWLQVNAWASAFACATFKIVTLNLPLGAHRRLLTQIEGWCAVTAIVSYSPE